MINLLLTLLLSSSLVVDNTSDENPPCGNCTHYTCFTVLNESIPSNVFAGGGAVNAITIDYESYPEVFAFRLYPVGEGNIYSLGSQNNGTACVPTYPCECPPLEKSYSFTIPSEVPRGYYQVKVFIESEGVTPIYEGQTFYVRNLF